MGGACPGGRSTVRRREPLAGPGEDGSVGRAGGGGVVFARDVEGEVEEWLTVRFDEGGEATGAQVVSE